MHYRPARYQCQCLATLFSQRGGATRKGIRKEKEGGKNPRGYDPKDAKRATSRSGRVRAVRAVRAKRINRDKLSLLCPPLPLFSCSASAPLCPLEQNTVIDLVMVRIAFPPRRSAMIFCPFLSADAGDISGAARESSPFIVAFRVFLLPSGFGTVRFRCVLVSRNPSPLWG